MEIVILYTHQSSKILMTTKSVIVVWILSQCNIWLILFYVYIFALMSWISIKAVMFWFVAPKWLNETCIN